MFNKQNFHNDFIKIVRDVEKYFPELDIKIKIYKEKITFLNSYRELYQKIIPVILKLIEKIEFSLNLFPNSPIIEELENNNLKLKKALIMLVLSRKDMFSKSK